ncbi:hypothetical protein [Shinella sp.]|uniref:hypothetical protein n=1 Tax=Shinella sp. TaxID=1870904 RepID=UPI003F71C92A
MTKAMNTVRAERMRQRQFDWRERSRIRWLSPKNEEQRQVVMNALGPSHPLVSRMIRCGNVSASNNMFYCGVPLCPRCFMRERGRQTRQAIRETFLDADNADVAFVTILLPARTDLSDVHDVIEKEKRRLRNFVERQRRLDSRWDDFQLIGFWEMGRMNFGEFESAGRKTKLALGSLGFPFIGEDDETVWLPHLHAIVSKGRLAEREIAKALRNDGHSAPYQIDVRPFHTYRKIDDNLKNVTRYSLKFRIENDPLIPDPLDFMATNDEVATTRDWWPAEDINAYAEWLCMERSGFQSLRFVLSGKSNNVMAEMAAELGNVGSSSERSPCRSSEQDVSVDQKASTEVKFHGSSDEDFDALFVMDDHVSYVGDVSVDVRNNNPLLDTNWTPETKVPPLSCTARRCIQANN